jgi:hypothetical protein
MSLRSILAVLHLLLEIEPSISQLLELLQVQHDRFTSTAPDARRTIVVLLPRVATAHIPCAPCVPRFPFRAQRASQAGLRR